MPEYKRIIQRTTNSNRIESGTAQLETNELAIIEDLDELVYKNKKGEWIFQSRYTVNTINDLKTKIYKINDIISILGDVRKGDSAPHFRIIQETNDGTGIKLKNDLWANKVKSLKDINLINTYDALRKLRNNNYDISFSLMGDSIWWQKNNGSAPPYLNNGTSYIYNGMIEALNEYIYKGKLSVAENLTFPGDDASRAYTRYENHDFLGDIVLIAYGANDTKFDSGATGDGGICFPVTNIKDTFDRHKKFMEKIIEKTILQGKIPVIIGCTAPRSYVQAYHTEADPNRQNMVLMADLDKDIAEEYGALYINAYDYMKNYTDSIFPGEDSVHPSEILRQLGKRIASNFVGLITSNSKYKTSVTNTLDLGVRKTFDNFMTSEEQPIVRRDTSKMWSNSGEYIILNENEFMVYSFYTDEPVLVYPQILQEYGTSVQVGTNFNTFEVNESKVFEDKNYAHYTKIYFESSNTVEGRILTLTSPYDILSAREKNNVNGSVRNIVAPLKILTKGFNTVYIKSTKGKTKVLGVKIIKMSNEKANSNSSSFSSVTDFNNLIQEGTFNFYKNTMSNLTLNLPPNYQEQTTAKLEVSTTFDGNLVNPFSIIQKFYTKNTVAVRSYTENSGWGRWIEISDNNYGKISWVEFSDFNDIKKGNYFGNTSNGSYNSILNKPPLTGVISINCVEYSKTIKFVTAISSTGKIVTRSYNSNWGEWTTATTSNYSYFQLDTPYYTSKMIEEGVYDEFKGYMDAKHEYDYQQREIEKQKQLAYKEALKENPNLTYEKFLENLPMLLPTLEEPQPSEALIAFKEKYLG